MYCTVRTESSRKAKMRVVEKQPRKESERSIATEEGEKKYGGDEVGDNIGRVGQGEVHLVEHVRYEVVPHCTYCHYLKCLKPCTRN